MREDPNVLKETEIKVSVANSEEEFKNTTIEELKNLLSEDGRYKDCAFFCNHKFLFDDRTLGSHGIKHKDVIVITPQIRPQGPSSEDGREFIPKTSSMEKLTLNM